MSTPPAPHQYWPEAAAALGAHLGRPEASAPARSAGPPAQGPGPPERDAGPAEPWPVAGGESAEGESAEGQAVSVENAASTDDADGPWEPPSWEQVVREHSDRVYRLSYRLTGNRADAEDLTQEVFVRVFRSLNSYTPGTFTGWLHRITTNLFLDHARRRRRLRFDALGLAAERVPASAEFASPERRFEHGNLAADVQAALDGLKPQYRAAVVLSDLEGLSYQEIAAVLGISMGTVRSRIHRGRAAMRAALPHRSAPSNRDASDPDPALQGT